VIKKQPTITATNFNKNQKHPQRLTLGNFALDFDIVLELARFQIHIDHLTWPETSLFHNVRLFQIRHNTRLTHHVNRPVLANRVPRGSQSVAIERGTNRLAVRKNQKRGSVPSFQEAAVELVKVNNFGIVGQVGVVFVGGGHHGHESAGRAVSRVGHELKDAVQVCRIGAVQIDDGFQD